MYFQLTAQAVSTTDVLEGLLDSAEDGLVGRRTRSYERLKASLNLTEVAAGQDYCFKS